MTGALGAVGRLSWRPDSNLLAFAVSHLITPDVNAIPDPAPVGLNY